ncbi:M1 family metallopeptidase [Petroclostridium sp. X23]|uniref:M1 family metallopeptidase n=1 Tax=Petroclostridium sp. X23 TaxID=3045146 RepID=UPI0024ACBD07|nr:M1 family metallopeptidase [Petroclostridium sp. X23]WHH57397.1 M1 family metallopeptidase [Petroclostridium sp. X23]
MGKKINRGQRILIFLLIFAGICGIVTVIYMLKSHKSLHNSYNINVEYNDRSKSLHCSQSIKITNNEKENLEALYFHLYPNAFKYKEQAPISEDEWSIAYPAGFSQGFIEVKEVNIDNTPVSFAVEGRSDIILYIKLPRLLKRRKSVEIFMEYDIQLPQCLNRFGYGESSINITNWYPILCVYDKGSWKLDPYYKIGDPFYSDTSDYQVTLSMPDQYEVAHTGKLISKEKDKDKGLNLLTITAENVRDFAWLASKDYEVIQNKCDKTIIKCFNYTKGGIRTLEIATKALKTFNRLFGEYPYRTLSIAESDFYVGGMEYPQVVQIDTSAYSDSKLWLEYLVVHEIAHQWWYGVIGNDQIREPWLDEGLTEYSTLLYFEMNYSVEHKEKIKDIFINSSVRSHHQENSYQHLINMPIYQYDNWQEYSVNVYSRGALLHEELRSIMGDGKYFKLLKRYYRNYRFKNASIKDFVQLANKINKKDLKVFFENKLGRIDQ